MVCVLKIYNQVPEYKLSGTTVGEYVFSNHAYIWSIIQIYRSAVAAYCLQRRYRKTLRFQIEHSGVILTERVKLPN